ncbi:lipase 3-like [Anticarsia gemmatalis]|uniref:lipase 3-like n=1 Tax=Anticarsia gemmatalis TaxID=129554 RepID=UPI003F75CFB1
MKAVSVLLCLALANGIAANIFREQYRPVDELEVQQLKYIDQYQRQHRNQPSEQKLRGEQRQQQLQGEQQRSQEQRDLQRNQEQAQQQQEQQHNQERQAQWNQQRQQHRNQQEQQSQSQEWEQTQKPQHRQQSVHSHPQQYQQYQKPAHQRVQFSQSSAQQSQEEQYSTGKHSQHTYSKHSSSSSSESSEESKEGRHYYDNEKSTSRTHNQKWQSPQYSVMNKQNKMVPAYSGEIAWNVLPMAEQIQSASVQENEDIENIIGDARRAMKQITEEDQVKFHQAYEQATQQANEDTELNATQLAQKHEYPVEEHTIKTDDGYVLTLFRIPPKKHIREVQKRPVVFLMHGILGSADDWLLMGPGKSLAYLLSDAGYDVWLGNARGNKYSKRHVSKHPAVADFWQYSTDEIALHDLPAMIDYALETTKQEKLYYIGHAQGTTAFFALTATRPEYNDKIIMMYALSPMVYMTNVRSPLFRMIAPTSKYYQSLQQELGNGAFNPKKELIRAVGGNMLEKAIGCKKVSSHVNFVMAGVDVDGLDAELIPVVMRHLPAGASTKVIKQYGQGVASQEFRKYDHGAKINQKVYGNEQPPKYEMEKVQAPVTLFYSEEDWLAHPKDVERLEKELPNVRETHKVSDEHFSHMDFQFSTKAPEHVYRRLIESMQNNQ